MNLARKTTNKWSIKASIIILSVLVVSFGALGLYSAFKAYGYIALLAGVFCGKASTHLCFQCKKNNYSFWKQPDCE